ncbi:MAG: hypothetical protein AAF135_26945, partial [Bacteroidota bacterium]
SNEKINWKEISRLNHIYGHGLNIGEDLFGVFLEEFNQATHQHLGVYVSFLWTMMSYLACFEHGTKLHMLYDTVPTGQ